MPEQVKCQGHRAALLTAVLARQTCSCSGGRGNVLKEKKGKGKGAAQRAPVIATWIIIWGWVRPKLIRYDTIRYDILVAIKYDIKAIV